MSQNGRNQLFAQCVPAFNDCLFVAEIPGALGDSGGCYSIHGKEIRCCWEALLGSFAAQWTSCRALPCLGEALAGGEGGGGPGMVQDLLTGR